ncbi:DUF2079 domain-containing protein, partial [Candidatus Margulisiibacteriota bacterium]
LAFIPLLGLNVLFLAIPSVGVNILSRCDYLVSTQYHYDYIQTAVIFFALIEGLYFMTQKLRRYRWLPLLLGVVLVVAASFGNVRYSLLPFTRYKQVLFNKIQMLGSRKIKAKRAAIRMIPPESSVSATYPFVPHLAHRREIYMFPNPYQARYWNMWFRDGRDLPPHRKKNRLSGPGTKYPFRR